jgi:hypothetical protein
MGTSSAYGLLQVSRVLAACFHSSCWTMVLLLQSWGCGVVSVLWLAPLLAPPWVEPYWPGTGEPSLAHLSPLSCPCWVSSDLISSPPTP